MRRFVLIISVFLMALFPLCGAYAEEQVYIDNPDFQYMDAESMPSGWYTDAWYTGDGDFFVEMDEVDGITCLHITNPAQNDVRPTAYQMEAARTFLLRALWRLQSP